MCCNMQRQHEETHCNTIQHTATHCNTLQHLATHCNQHEEANMKNHSWTECAAVCYNRKRRHEETHCNTIQHTATHCNTLQHTATHCNTQQHTATHHNQNVDVNRQINMLKRQIWKTTHGQANMRLWPLHSHMKWRLFALIYTLMRLWPKPTSVWYRGQTRKPHVIKRLWCRV